MWRGEKMIRPIQQIRHWLGVCLAMVMLVTLILPPMPLHAASNNITFADVDGNLLPDNEVHSAVVASSRTISDLYIKYGGTDPEASFDVYVNGKKVQTLTKVNLVTGKPQLYKISSFDLAIGSNTVRVNSVKDTAFGERFYKYVSNDQPVFLDDYINEGTSPYDAYPYGDPRITLKGTFGAGVVGGNLRIEIVTGNGQTVSGLEKLTPSISGSTFTFSDVSLQPGLNKIVFYERKENGRTDHLTFYVNYNNTPILEELKIEDVDLSPTGTTLVSVPSANRLVLNFNGIAKNADTVEVENITNKQTVNGSVNKNSGFFGLNLPVVFGENTLRIRVYNKDKQVGTFTRNILVATTSQNESDLLYSTKVNGQTWNPDEVSSLSNGLTNVDIVGNALLSFVEDVQVKKFKQFRYVIKSADPRVTFEVSEPVTEAMTDSNNVAYKGYVIDGSSSGFTNFKAVTKKGFNLAGLQVGSTYELSLQYVYESKDSEGNWVDRTVDLPRYKYQFKYVDGSAPQFVSAMYDGKQMSTTSTTTLAKNPAVITVETRNMTNLPASSGNTNPNSGNILKVKINNTELSSADFRYTYTAGNSFFTIELLNPDIGSGTLQLIYDPSNKNVSAEYRFKWQIAPYVQLTYRDRFGEVRSFYDGIEINDPNNIPNLDGRVFNYTINSTGSNVKAKIANIDNAISNVDPASGTFKINLADLINRSSNKLVLNKGTNKLVVTLSGLTDISFTYNLLYITSKAPTIEDVKLWVEHNGDETELSQKSGAAAFETGAAYLSKFSFNVKDATHVYIEKNGKRIVDYRMESGKWTQDKSNPEYIKVLDDIPSSLGDRFNSVNFKNSRDKFEATTSTSEYNNILRRVQELLANKPNDQDATLALFPLNLKKNDTTTYTLIAEDDNGTIVRYNVNVSQKTNSWEVISPVKARPDDKYITVNANSVQIKVFAEKADKVLFGKTEAVVTNTKDRDFVFNKELSKAVPLTYYVFTGTVPLKKGINTVKYTVEVGGMKYNDQVVIYNASASVDGAEFRDVLGKKVSFSAFDKALELKFPSGTVLLSPSNDRAGEEVKNPADDIFVDVPLYFGIADRTTGQVSLPGTSMRNRLTLDATFNYASPLYYIDAGDVDYFGGRDPYYEEDDGAEDFRSRYEENLVPSKQGTLSIKYDSAIVNAANNVITVYYHNGFEWQNIGGVVNTGKKVIVVPFKGFGYYMVMKNRESFEDVVRHDFARDAMETLYSKGIMPAYSASSFGANRDMTRGEFATMLVKALDLEIKAGPYHDSNQRDPVEPTFVDVRPSRDTWDYEYKYIETAARAGIIRGKEPGYFRPDDSLTREEAAIMISRALNMKVGSLDAAKLALNKMFTDGKDVGHYATASVLAVAKAKLMNGEPNDPNEKKPTFSFKPQNNLTRAEMAVITIRVMVQLKKLPKQ